MARSTTALLLLGIQVVSARGHPTEPTITTPPKLVKRDTYGIPDWSQYWPAAAQEVSDYNGAPISSSDLALISSLVKYGYDDLVSSCSELYEEEGSSCEVTNTASPYAFSVWDSYGGVSGILSDLKTDDGTSATATDGAGLASDGIIATSTKADDTKTSTSTKEGDTRTSASTKKGEKNDAPNLSRNLGLIQAGLTLLGMML